MKFKLIAVLSLAFALLLGACGGKSDAELQGDADKALKGNETTSGVTVEVKDGVATIKGDVADEAAKSKAEELAKVEGVKSVVNEVSVKAPAPTPQASGSDEEVKKAIEDGWKKAGCDGATVEVKDGEATLTGTVASDKFAQCVQAASLAKPKSLKNELQKK